MQSIDSYRQKLADINNLCRETSKNGYGAHLVIPLNRLANKFAETLDAFVEISKEVDEVATARPEFGSNRNTLRQLMVRKETAAENLDKICIEIDNIENNILAQSGITNSFIGNQRAPLYNPINAFPECVPVSQVDVPNNLYLIKDKELDNYHSMMNEFLCMARDVYANLNAEHLGGKYASTIANIGMLIKSTEKVLSMIDDLISKRDYYNNTCCNIHQNNPQYIEYESYPNEYEEAKSIIIDIYTINCDKFDAIMRSIN